MSTEDELIASFRPTFTVGQRVRVRLSGECDYQQTHSYTTDIRGFAFFMNAITGHQQNEHDRSGVVVHVNEVNYPSIRGHKYLVKFDDELPSRVVREPQFGLQYAATELEALDVFVEDHADPDDLDEHGHFKPGVDASAAFNRAMRKAEQP